MSRLAASTGTPDTSSKEQTIGSIILHGQSSCAVLAAVLPRNGKAIPPRQSWGQENGIQGSGIRSLRTLITEPWRVVHTSIAKLPVVPDVPKVQLNSRQQFDDPAHLHRKDVITGVRGRQSLYSIDMATQGNAPLLVEKHVFILQTLIDFTNSALLLLFASGPPDRGSGRCSAVVRSSGQCDIMGCHRWDAQ
ncbi:hypothetical protein CERZMDRAFT_98583 [Cercospora zeae-maydis SCOH1-5]|uniref:Uncharacterized protein n=1 Tax=Cercospora zeae-maydis SCOH1-5 TaxID=717836 RepID=A0A6A6FD12_9PEZI|nr:hypothetical protein CERZMDRAFT_98583 [Cercospora zeae-maydis SCOH1-5]